ncbi:hypothetical protein [Microlunatus parietis]|uniref:Peptidase C14 n=1 Tax=Microlunatus parietis TaxID=682979 RepID=A0A7Y9IBQ8_9ACTN|nr:hypothetical protein [Microlunatus parietis]NYE73887.1 hypothetical protein [Microlunatus parietis]
MMDDSAVTPPVNQRRAFLSGVGLAAVGGSVVAAALAPSPAAAATESLAVVDTVRQLAAKPAQPGDLAMARGYSEIGDVPGPLLYRFVADDPPAVNGGTVLRGRGRSVWVLLHDGVVDFRRFGIFDAATPADDALDAMLADPTIHRIEAHTPLNFTRRHRTGRSAVELDFGHQVITTRGIEDAAADDPFAAVIFFRGKITDEVQQATLGETVPDLADILPVADASFFSVGAWYAAEVNGLAGRWERELQRLLQVTEIVDGTHIRVNYKIGWELGKDRSITWTRVEPVHDVRVANLIFEGGGKDQFTGSHPVAFEYAVRCDVDSVEATKTFWPVVMRRWNTYFRTTNCSLANPVSVTWGGAGYLTQQIYCLYGYVANCHTSNARHLNDWTASAYGLVENCHGDGDDQGPFVTHGQYEHDLTYVGNSGLITFANSGAAWGSAAKRITVRQHVCSWFVARVKVTDLTLEDVQVIGKPSLAGSGMLWINADGAQLRGCTATGPLVVTQQSRRSARPTTISDSSFAFAAGATLTNGTVTAPITMIDTTLRGVGGMIIAGTGEITFRGCTLTAAEGSAPVSITVPRVRFAESVLTEVGLTMAGDEDQQLVVSGSTMIGSGTGIGRSGGAELTVLLEGSELRRTDPAGSHVRLTEGTNHYRASASRFTGGRLDLAAGGFAAPSTLIQVGCVESGVVRGDFPADGERVSTAGSLAV